MLTVEFEINTNDAELIEPTFNDFDFYSQKSIASAVTIKNGIKSAKVTHKYYLKPKRIGLSTIEKVTFDYFQRVCGRCKQTIEISEITSLSKDTEKTASAFSVG